MGHLVSKKLDFRLTSEEWMAPESIIKQEYSTKSDVWSYAITLIGLSSQRATTDISTEIIIRQEPYPGELAMNACVRVAYQGQRHAMPPNAPPLLAQVIRCCWEEKPEDRPSFQEIHNMLQNGYGS